jgi:hypothetical protein
MHNRVDVEFTGWCDGLITKPGFYRAVADGETDISCIEVKNSPDGTGVERVSGVDEGYPWLEDWPLWIGPYATEDGALMAWCPPVISGGDA